MNAPWWGFHAKPVSFLNIFSGDLHFDILIIRFYQTSLIVGQTPGAIEGQRGFTLEELGKEETLYGTMS